MSIPARILSNMCAPPSDRTCVLFTNRYSELIPALMRVRRLLCIVHPTEPQEQIAELRARCPAGVALLSYTPGRADATVQELRRLSPSLIITYSFQHILPTDYLSVCPGINLHPSLLPAYPGLNPWQEQIRDGVKESGYTIHRLTPQADAGQILCRVSYTWPDPLPEPAELRDSSLRLYAIPLLLNLLANNKDL